VSVQIRRGFVSVADGQVHYRTAGEGGTPLVMLHPSPASAFMLQPLIKEMAKTRRVIATDTLGNGDSSAPLDRNATILYLANAHVEALNGLGIDRFDLYGTHTGANIAVEIAIAYPERVRRLILDGVSLYSADERADMSANYAPEIQIDLHGSQFNWVWHFVRDVFLFWPWYKRDREHRRPTGLPSADQLHDKAVEVLKAARTYHISYRAAIGYDKADRLPMVTVTTLLTCARDDMLMEYFAAVHALMPGAEAVVTDGIGSAGALERTGLAFRTFLDSD
jgi:pimeloyl-ACP methyl ester carboxylesterase